MLILQRYEGDTIKIGDDITITITKIRGGQAHVGIEAPPTIKILRGELGAWNEKAEDSQDAQKGN